MLQWERIRVRSVYHRCLCKSNKGVYATMLLKVNIMSIGGS